MCTRYPNVCGCTCIGARYAGVAAQATHHKSVADWLAGVREVTASTHPGWQHSTQPAGCPTLQHSQGWLHHLLVEKDFLGGGILDAKYMDPYYASTSSCPSSSNTPPEAGTHWRVRQAPTDIWIVAFGWVGNTCCDDY